MLSQRLEYAGCCWVHPGTLWSPQITWMEVCAWQELVCVTLLGAEGSSIREMLHPKSPPSQGSLPVVAVVAFTLPTRGTVILRSIPRPSRVQALEIRFPVSTELENEKKGTSQFLAEGVEWIIFGGIFQPSPTQPKYSVPFHSFPFLSIPFHSIDGYLGVWAVNPHVCGVVTNISLALASLNATTHKCHILILINEF